MFLIHFSELSLRVKDLFRKKNMQRLIDCFELNRNIEESVCNKQMFFLKPIFHIYRWAARSAREHFKFCSSPQQLGAQVAHMWELC